ncbi:MAG: hypothetical protein QW751_03245, partial [Candidatus Aenigmatarchaeota archaeon]
ETGVDTINNYVWANITEFSVFAPLSIDNTAPTWSDNQSSYPSKYSPSTYSQFNITWTDNVGMDTVLFESNYSGTPQNYTMSTYGGSIYSYSTILPAGTFYWKSWANDTNNNWNVSDTWYITIEKAPTAITLLLNGTDGDKTYPTGSVANFTVILNVSGKTVYLDSNMTGWVLQSGTTPLMNYTTIQHVGRFNITGYFPGDANYSSSLSTHFTRGGKPDGSNCTSPSDCLGGYCVHGICRSSSTYCGDNYCDSGEDCASCSADCGACPMPPIQLPPPKPPEEKPPVAVPTVPTTEWPTYVVTSWTPGQVFDVPPQGMTLLIEGNLLDGSPQPGASAVIIFPSSKITINELHKIDASTFAPLPKTDSITAVQLSAAEISITGGQKYFCANWEGTGFDANTVTVYSLYDGVWTELPSAWIIKNLTSSVICANITAAGTPFLIAGLVPVMPPMPAALPLYDLWIAAIFVIVIVIAVFGLVLLRKQPKAAPSEVPEKAEVTNVKAKKLKASKIKKRRG